MPSSLFPVETQHNLLPKNDVNPFYILKSEFSEELLEKMFAYYFKDIDWEQDSYNFNGKTVKPRRKTYMFGKDYNYSGQIKKGNPFDKQTLYIKKKLEKLLNLEEGILNGCLLNLYPDGKSSISPHKDDEKDMIEDAPIIVLSLGATRQFFLQNDDKTLNKEDRNVKYKISSGDVLVMNPETQKNWKHSIPKELNVLEPRISLTFRCFK